MGVGAGGGGPSPLRPPTLKSGEPITWCPPPSLFDVIWAFPSFCIGRCHGRIIQFIYLVHSSKGVPPISPKAGAYLEVAEEEGQDLLSREYSEDFFNNCTNRPISGESVYCRKFYNCTDGYFQLHIFIYNCTNRLYCTLKSRKSRIPS